MENTPPPFSENREQFHNQIQPVIKTLLDYKKLLENLKSQPSWEGESDTYENERRASAITSEFAKEMNRNSFYNDNLDMDQQGQEYWDNL